MIKKIYTPILAIIFLALASCGGGEKAEEIISDEEKSVPSIETSKFNAQNVFNSLPDRQVIMKLIGENKIEYNPDFANDPKLVTKYSIELSKAINLGIYGSDLSIASSFDQTQESMVFLKCVNVLAGHLGVNSAFDHRMFERIDANENNKDSILEIVTGAFRKVDEILKYNNRPATSAVILSGCWIEGLYVSCQIAQAQTGDLENIIKTIVEQKESLKNLIVMLEGVELEDNAKYIVDDLRELYKAFEVAETNTKLNKETIAGITQIISGLRNKVTKA